MPISYGHYCTPINMPCQQGFLWYSNKLMEEDHVKPEQVSGQSDQNAKDANAGPPPVAPVDVSKEKTPSDTSNPAQNKAKRKRKPLSCFEIWTVSIAVAAIVVAGLTGLAIYWQDKIAAKTLGEIQRQYPELQKSATAAMNAAGAAQSQVDLMRQQLGASSAAVLRFEIPLADSEPNLENFGVTFRNVGHANATDIYASIDLSLRSIPDNRQIVTTRSIRKQVATLIAPPSDEPDPYLARYEWEVLRPIPSEEITMITEGDAAISADFSLSYYDGFNPRSFKSCYSHMEFSVSLNATTKSEKRESVECKDLPMAMADFATAKAAAEKQKAQHPN